VDRLANTPELLDGPLDDRDALVGNLRDLRRANALLGGTRLSARAVDALVAATPEAEPTTREITILDVGTGAADIPAALVRRAARRGRRLEAVAVDSRVEVLEAAAALDRSLATTPGLTLRVSDGRSLPFDDGAFDVAHSSLVVHHLEPDDAVAFLWELRRVSRRGVVLNDLLRSRLTWLGAALLGRIATRNRLSRNDAPLSARRAYDERELVDLLAAAGLEPVNRFRGFARHRIAIAARSRGNR
jgi:ubiquinone/menaquinone biosynthesis C-methylase UbiE